MKIDKQHENIVRLSDIRRDRYNASSLFGPVNPASTTWRAQEIHRANQEAQLLELLSSLEREVASLQSRFSTVYDMLNDVTQKVYFVLHSGTQTVEAGTDSEL